MFTLIGSSASLALRGVLLGGVGLGWEIKKTDSLWSFVRKISIIPISTAVFVLSVSSSTLSALIIESRPNSILICTKMDWPLQAGSHGRVFKPPEGLGQWTLVSYCPLIAYKRPGVHLSGSTWESIEDHCLTANGDCKLAVPTRIAHIEWSDGGFSWVNRITQGQERCVTIRVIARFYGVCHTFCKTGLQVILSGYCGQECNKDIHRAWRCWRMSHLSTGAQHEVIFKPDVLPPTHDATRMTCFPEPRSYLGKWRK